LVGPGTKYTSIIIFEVSTKISFENINLRRSQKLHPRALLLNFIIVSSEIFISLIYKFPNNGSQKCK
jgi:hypothetical protein